MEDYREELALSLTSARELAATSIRNAQQRYKRLYDQKAVKKNYQVGDWVLVKFPQEESGKQRKLSRPWHGPAPESAARGATTKYTLRNTIRPPRR